MTTEELSRLMDAEMRFNQRLRAIAKVAVLELGLDLQEFLNAARLAYQVASRP